MKVGVKVLVLIFCAFSFIGCDRVTKNLAKEHLMNKDSISFFHDTFRLVYIENTGAFLGLGAGLSKAVGFWVLSVIPLLIMLCLFAYTLQKSKTLAFSKVVVLTLIVSGGLGNVIDRMLYDRHVTDFMNLGIGSFRTGIFNFADGYVTFGTLALLLFFKGDKAETPVIAQDANVN